MASIRPFVPPSAGERTVRVLKDDDQLNIEPIAQTLTYSSGELQTIVTVNGTKTFAYSSGRLSSISDTETGKVQTFNYTGEDLTSITISDI